MAARDPGAPPPSREDPSDPFSRANYRSLIAWPARLRREGPFIEKVLDGIPDPSVADLGCGTGEHARLLASKGLRVAGLDRSKAMLADATKEPAPPNLSFHEGEIAEADRVLPGKYGAAIILGNTVAFLFPEEELRRALGAIRRILVPGGRLLFQMLNYRRLYARKERHLPLNFNDAEDGTVVFLRLLDLRPNGQVLFFPTTLRFRPDSEDSPVEVVRTRRVELRAWTDAELVPALGAAGFEGIHLFGTMEGGEYHPLESTDLVVVASAGPSPSALV